MPGARRSFEQRIEAAIAAHDDLSPEIRAEVLTQTANQLRATDD